PRGGWRAYRPPRARRHRAGVTGGARAVRSRESALPRPNFRAGWTRARARGSPLLGRGQDHPLLPEPRRLPAPGPEIEELGAADVPRLHHLDPLDPGRVEGERPLDADAVGDAPDGEAGPRALAALPDDHALEDLDALLLTLDDLHVHAHGVARGEVSPVALEHPRLDDGDRVGPHGLSPSRSTRGRSPPR